MGERVSVLANTGNSGLSGMVQSGNGVALPAGHVRHYKNGTGLWKDAAKTLEATSGESIYVWEDQDGNADRVQATEGNRPVVEDGGAKFTTASSHYLSEAPAPARPTSFTILTKLHVDDITVRQVPTGCDNSSGSSPWGSMDVSNVAHANGVIRSAIFDGTNYTVTRTTNPAFANGVTVVVTLRYTAGQTTVEIYVDGAKENTDVLTDASGNTGVAVVPSLGRSGELDSLYFGGTIYEFVRYNSALSDADRVAAEAYMAAV